ETVTETERRPVIEWVDRFARTSRWADVRSLCIWGCRGEKNDLRVAVRAELFSQIHAPELSKVTPKRLAELCVLYGLGTPCKVAGGDRRAVELVPDFVQDLLRRGCPDPKNVEDGRADGQDRQSASREEPASVRP